MTATWRYDARCRSRRRRRFHWLNTHCRNLAIEQMKEKNYRHVSSFAMKFQYFQRTFHHRAIRLNALLFSRGLKQKKKNTMKTSHCVSCRCVVFLYNRLVTRSKYYEYSNDLNYKNYFFM